MLPALVFVCKQELGGYSYSQIFQIENEGALCIRLCVWSKVGLEFFPSGCTFNTLLEMR